MQNSVQYRQKKLQFTYEEYISAGKTLNNQVIDQRYAVYNRIGEGSNGQVYRGVDKNTKKQIAIKLMDLREINNLSNATVKSIKLRLSESQPRLMFICNSQNLMKCHDVYSNSDLKIMILQYCNGKTLQAEIDQKRRIPEKEAIQIVKHLINGLMEMHRHKIVHRDLKAENIMSHNGTYKIIDFGFSKKLLIAQQNAEVKGTSLGTITTMAPQVMSRRPYGLKADIWSLGIIFFQMIFGIYPYDSLTAPSLYQQIRTKKLFQSPDPPTINGYTPSRQGYEFFKFLVVFDTQERPSWKQVSQYPLIKNQSDQVAQRFIKKVDVIPDEKLNNLQIGSSMNQNTNEEINQKQSPYGAKRKQQAILKNPIPVEKEKPKSKFINIEDRMKQQQQQEKLKLKQEQAKKLKYLEKTMMKLETGQKKVVVEKKNEVKSQFKELDNQQRLQYLFTQKAHLQCLKTQFIFRQIVNPILSTNYLPQNDRVNVQFIYLLLARCFNNMSPIRDELEKRVQNKDLIENLNEQITPLYNQVRQKFIEFSNMLTKMESKFTSVIGDFFKKKMKGKEFEEKDRFLTGIEIANYSKAQQIQYTNRYYMQNIKGKINAINNLSNVYKRLNKYIQINEITQQQLQYSKKTFASTVADLL